MRPRQPGGRQTSSRQPGHVGPKPFFNTMIKTAHNKATLYLVWPPCSSHVPAESLTYYQCRSAGLAPFIAQPATLCTHICTDEEIIRNTPVGQIGRVSSPAHEFPPRQYGGSGGRGDLCPSPRTPASPSSAAVTSQPGSSVLRDGASPLRQVIGWGVDPTWTRHRPAASSAVLSSVQAPSSALR